MRSISAVFSQSRKRRRRRWLAAHRDPHTEMLALNIKALGYQLARSLAVAMPPIKNSSPQKIGIGSKLSTQADLESAWAQYWLAELQIPFLYHRKLWELAYVLQALYDADLLTSGSRGLGFGCAGEPIASYLAHQGVETLITDLPEEDCRSAGWQSTGQHLSSLESAYHAHLVSREDFDRQVKFRAMDMNRIDADLTDFDFCWSICAAEHLGSIKKGLTFLERSLDTLRPGGTALHTAEFNINPDGPTLDDWPTVLFQRRHMEALSERLAGRGHTVAVFDFNPGKSPLDQFIDLPPFAESTWGALSQSLGQPIHLKVGFEGYVTTCVGIRITKKH